jgi:DNA-binding SARP family transcriptional activator
LDFRVLGPLDVYRGSSALPLGGRTQRALLTLLLLHANEVVSCDRLIEGVWGEAPPRTVDAGLRVYVSKIRKLLGSADSQVALLSRPPGYVLELEPGQLDLHRFERLVHEGREALAAKSAEKAAARLGEALALWRGDPLADLPYASFTASTVGRLIELRLCALEDRIEAELALGRHFDLVPELEALVAEYPLRERLRAQLMLSLYRTGRQSEALQAYRVARRLLAEELGLDPGPELQDLEKAILVQDRSLAPAPAKPARAAHWFHRLVGAAVRGSRSGPARRSSRLLAAGAGIVAVAIAVPMFVIGQGRRPDAVFASGDDIAVIEPRTSKVVARVPVGSSPTLIREGDGSVWVADDDEQTVTQIDPERRSVVRTIGIGFRPDDLAARDGAVWAFDKEGGILEKLPYEEVSNRFERRGFAGLDHMAVADKAVWLSGGRRLIRVDALTGRVVKRADVPGDLIGVAVGAGAVWAVTGPGATVLRIDPRTGAVTDRIAIVRRPSALPPGPIGIAADDNFVWVLNGNSATPTVAKIDPKLRGVVAMLPLDVDRGAIRLAAGEGAVWVSNADDGTLTRIDAETDAMTSITVAPHDRPTDVTVAGGLVWVSVDAPSR